MSQVVDPPRGGQAPGPREGGTSRVHSAVHTPFSFVLSFIPPSSFFAAASSSSASPAKTASFGGTLWRRCAKAPNLPPPRVVRSAPLSLSGHQPTPEPQGFGAGCGGICGTRQEGARGSDVAPPARPQGWSASAACFLKKGPPPPIRGGDYLGGITWGLLFGGGVHQPCSNTSWLLG